MPKQPVEGEIYRQTFGEEELSVHGFANSLTRQTIHLYNRCAGREYPDLGVVFVRGTQICYNCRRRKVILSRRKTET